MPYIKVHIHFVWSTKNWVPYLRNRDLRFQLWHHIRENGREKGIYIDSVNGYTNHCHCLVSISSQQSLAKIVQWIKGESSHWVNKNFKDHLGGKKFDWQDDYWVVSVSESILPRVRQYIFNQEKHHQKVSPEQEYQDFLRLYGFEER